MQGAPENPENVVSLFAGKSNRPDASVNKDMNVEEIFADTIRKNKEVADRMKKERNKNNKTVLRSYRIKP